MPPARPDRVSRPHLIQRLDRGLDQGLVLVSAPAGFGKTTLLVEWAGWRAATGRPARVAWLALDEGDNDPLCFWRYVVAALQGAGAAQSPAVGAALESLYPFPLDPAHDAALDALVITLLNDLVAARGDPCVLVLDDLHVIEAAPIHRSLDRTLEHLPPQLRLVLTTRADPPLALARRRARGELCEIRAADLRFTGSEVTDFLNGRMGLGLSPAQVAALETRTEGWIAGMQMAALSLQGERDRQRMIAAFAGDDRYVADYLIAEVLERQPAQVRAFLLRTSILDRLCAPLCDALLEADTAISSQETLEYLERTNLFTLPLDNRRRWYRYHRLFADLLQRRLRESAGAEGVAHLHRQASAWYEGEGLLAQAVHHALAAPDLERAATLLERHALPVLFRGQITSLVAWLDALPAALRRTRPALCVASAWMALITGFGDRLERARQWLHDAGDLATAGAETAASAAALEAYLTFEWGQDSRRVVERAFQALETLPVENGRVRATLYFLAGQAYLALGELDAALEALAEGRRGGAGGDAPFIALMAAFLEAHVLRERGRLYDAAAVCRQVIAEVVEPLERGGAALPFAHLPYIILGSVLYEWNDLPGAARALDKASEQAPATLAGHLIAETERHLWLSRLRQAQGDAAGAQALFESVAQGQDGRLAIVFGDLFAACRARLELALAESDPAYLVPVERWMKAQQVTLGDEPRVGTIVPLFNRDWNRLTLARFLLARRRGASSSAEGPDLRPLLAWLAAHAEQALAAGWTGQALESLLLSALALQACDDLPAALAVLDQALSLAEGQGYVRLFLDEGPAMARLLYRAAESGLDAAYAGRLLSGFGEAPVLPAPALSPSGAGGPALVEPLSERELEVLQLVAEGLSNREIAARLFIAVGTVKVHTTNIYGKLGVRSRTQAVAMARTLGLLSEP